MYLLLSLILSVGKCHPSNWPEMENVLGLSGRFSYTQNWIMLVLTNLVPGTSFTIFWHSPRNGDEFCKFRTKLCTCRKGAGLILKFENHIWKLEKYNKLDNCYAIPIMHVDWPLTPKSNPLWLRWFHTDDDTIDIQGFPSKNSFKSRHSVEKRFFGSNCNRNNW